MALLFYITKIKQVLFSKVTCCDCQVTFFCMKCPIKRRALFQKDMLEKLCAVIKSYRWHVEKIIYLLRNNAKYRNVKSLKGNKVKWSDIRGLWKKKKYSEENIVSIRWQVLKLLVLTVPVRQVSLKKSNVIEVNELIVFFVLYSTVLLILVF